jgi:glycosyltransferase involved in cell wall biosynthesis
MKVTILDSVPHNVMPMLYTRAYVTVAPLTRGPRNELQGCCPLKIVESMANGTPVIASNLPVVRELISSGVEGMLFSPGSPRSLGAVLEAVLDDGAVRGELAFGASRRAQRDFGAKLFAERLCAVYNSLTGG